MAARMPDAEFIRRFERVELNEFTHADHIRLTLAYLDLHDEASTLELLADGLSRFAASKGKPEKFHYTLTRAWLTLVINARRAYPEARTVDVLLACCPPLGDSKVILRFYSEARLFSDAARRGWLPPDLLPLAATL